MMVAQGVLEGLIRDNETSPLFYLSAFGLSLILGALHAMSPGHGKTVVAAYLVGASGRFYHAIALGSIVTLTHTGSVFALGLATLAASSYFMPTDVFPLLEIISGLLILILGISLLAPRLRNWLKKRRLLRILHHQTPGLVAPLCQVSQQRGPPLCVCGKAALSRPLQGNRSQLDQKGKEAVVLMRPQRRKVAHLPGRQRREQPRKCHHPPLLLTRPHRQQRLH